MRLYALRCDGLNVFIPRGFPFQLPKIEGLLHA